jgi:hypothetical protein
VPATIYSQTLASLTATRTKMLSPEWQAALDGESADVRLQASLSLMKVQQAITALSNAVLADIADQMTAQEGALTASTTALTNALKKITNVQKVMDAVTSVLTTVATILPLL